MGGSIGSAPACFLQQLSEFEFRHLSKKQNGQHKQRSGQHPLARQKNKHISANNLLPCTQVSQLRYVIFFHVVHSSANNLLPYSSMYTSQTTTFCHILPCTHLSQQPSSIFFHAHISANNLLPYSSITA